MVVGDPREGLFLLYHRDVVGHDLPAETSPRPDSRESSVFLKSLPVIRSGYLINTCLGRLEINSDLGEAHTIMAKVAWNQLDRVESQRQFLNRDSLNDLLVEPAFENYLNRPEYRELLLEQRLI